jgi:hypothetical protein
MKNLFIMKAQPEKVEDIMARLFPEHTVEEWKKLFPVKEENNND